MDVGHCLNLWWILHLRTTTGIDIIRIDRFDISVVSFSHKLLAGGPEVSAENILILRSRYHYFSGFLCPFDCSDERGILDGVLSGSMLRICPLSLGTEAYLAWTISQGHILPSS